MTVSEFLAWETRQELRYEFSGFQPVAMTDALYSGLNFQPAAGEAPSAALPSPPEPHA